MNPALIQQLYSPSLELILLVIAVVANGLLAYVVYRSNPKSASSQIFALLSVTTAFWLITNYLTNNILPLRQYSDLILIINRFGIFFAAPMSTLLFLLAHTIPSEKILLGRKTLYTIIGLTVLMMLVNVSPFAFVDITFSNGALELIPGSGLMLFSVLSTLFSILAVYWLIRKYYKSKGNVRHQLGVVVTGMLIMLALIIGTILVPIILFSSLSFLGFTPIYTLVFLGMTAYAITKYSLFDIKVLVTEALTLVVWLVLFAKLFGAESFNAFFIDFLILLFLVVFGFLLIRSVRREVEQRKLIETQEKELEVANREQETLLHFMSHEVKGYLTESQAGFASIVEGDLGTVPEQVKAMATKALGNVRRGVSTIMDILDASNFKKGTVAYKKETFDFRAAIRDVVKTLEPDARAKGLTIDLDIGEGAFTFTGDEDKLKRHVLRNLIDNAIKYTPKGAVKVSLTDGKVIRFSIKDSGVGITPEDKKKLFTEGGHGKDSIKVNVHSTGYGLYIAKKIVDAHGGHIWAESEGQGKGSKFIIEFPALA